MESSRLTVHSDEVLRCHREGEKRNTGETEEKQVHNRCDRTNWKIWKRAKRENANDCVGEQWISGDGVEQRFSAVIKMTCWGGEVVEAYGDISF